jgi:Uma2 family endonuclease
VPQTAPRRIPPPTVEEYLRFEDASAPKHEYVAGQVYPRAAVTARHSLIAGNIAAQLWMAPGDGPCHVYDSDMCLRIGNAAAVHYPDVQEWSVIRRIRSRCTLGRHYRDDNGRGGMPSYRAQARCPSRPRRSS